MQGLLPERETQTQALLKNNGLGTGEALQLRRELLLEQILDELRRSRALLEVLAARATQPPPKARNLEDLTVSELRAIASELQIPHYAKLRRPALLKTIRQARQARED